MYKNYPPNKRLKRDSLQVNALTNPVLARSYDDPPFLAPSLMMEMEEMERIRWA